MRIRRDLMGLMLNSDDALTLVIIRPPAASTVHRP